MDETAWRKWFEGIWADREERIYPAMFGDLGPGIFPLTAKTFQEMGGEADPRWLHHGVFESPPNERRDHWVYVSSGMSNAWGESPETVKPEEFSGLGMEFVLHTDSPGQWAMDLMHWFMAVQLMAASGQLEGGIVEYYDRVRFRPTENAGEVSKLLVVPPEPEMYPGRFELGSGVVDVMALVGISERESEFVRTQGPEAFVKLLKHHGVWPRTSLKRVSVI
jgi:hypothetical protein